MIDPSKAIQVGISAQSRLWTAVFGGHRAYGMTAPEAVYTLALRGDLLVRLTHVRSDQHSTDVQLVWTGAHWVARHWFYGNLEQTGVHGWAMRQGPTKEEALFLLLADYGGKEPLPFLHFVEVLL